MRNTGKRLLGLCPALVIGFAAALLAQDHATGTAQHKKIAKTPAASAHVMLNEGDLKWGPAPPGLPPGSQAALLEGNPGAAGRYTVRMKASDGYRIPPHWHPTGESLTILSGSVMLASGWEDTLDESTAVPMAAGSYTSMPPKMKHSVVCKGDCELQVSAMGPFQITYVNPADDPRKGTGAK